MLVDKSDLKKLLDPYDDTQTECDGMTRICHTLLSELGLDHQPMMGRLTVNCKVIEPHLWMDLPSGDCIDYRARMWLGDEAPHGIFNPKDFPNAIYKGKPIELKTLTPTMFAVLTLKLDLELIFEKSKS